MSNPVYSPLGLNDFLRSFKDVKELNPTSRYCFLLGAGASKSSGIPLGSELANKWFKIIKEDLTEETLKKWIEKEGIDEKDLASSYSKIYERRFRANPANGYAEIQKQLENKEPSIGYAYFAKILAETPHRFVITTNFDSLIEDSLFIYTQTKPLVCGHESLAGYINIHGSRPSIVKIHRDVLFDPISDKEGTNLLKEQWKNALKPLLSNFHLVVIGYGGNDGSLMDYLKELKEIRKPLYWCIRKGDSINEKTNRIMKEGDFSVEIDGFDEFMIEPRSAFALDINPEDIVKNAQQRKEKFEEQRNKLTKKTQEQFEKTGEKPSEAIAEILSPWWKYQSEINKEQDIDKKNQLYLDSITESPNSPELTGNYASFLHTIRKAYDDAEKYYQKALEIDPNHANNNGNYAVFLSDIRKAYDDAEKYYQKALEIDPNRANANGNYAGFLLGRKRKEEATFYLEKAFELILKQPREVLELELWFYRLAHYPKFYEKAKANIERLLKEKTRSIGGDFSMNIEQAETKKHPHLEELKDYARRITADQIEI